MLIYPLYGKTVKELVETYKVNGYKYSLYKSKTDLINGLLLRLSFNGFKRMRVERLEEEVTTLRNGQCIPEVAEGEVAEEEVAEGADSAEVMITSAITSAPTMNLSNPLLNPVCPDEELSSFIDGLRLKYIYDTLNFNPFNDELKCQQYFNYKEHFIRRCGNLGEHGEMLLFHGTDQQNIQSILDYDLSLNGPHSHGNAYGHGLYFTNRLEYACNYSTDVPDKKYILICKVHVGDVTLGNRNMVRPPMNTETNKRFDTAVNIVNDPYVFVKFKNDTYNILGFLEISVNESSTLNRRMGRGLHRGGHVSIKMSIRDATIYKRSKQSHGTVTGHNSSSSSTQLAPSPRYKVDDKVMIIGKDFNYDEYKIQKIINNNDKFSYDIIHSSGGSSDPATRLHGGVYFAIEEKNLHPHRNHHAAPFSLTRNPSQKKASLSITNSTGNSIAVYFKPEGKCIYKHSVNEFKLMDYIGPDKKRGYITNVGDEFVCADKDNIIRVIKVEKDKEYIDITM